MAELSKILKERGFVYQHSSETLEEITDGGQRTVYLGVDPTAESIHVGNLAAYMLLKHFANAGHKVILIVGGGTGMIGDPKPDIERPLLDEVTIANRVEKLKEQAGKLLGGTDFHVANNADWLTRLGLLEFLRDTGKYFTVNNLVKKDAIHARMKSEEGISFTEFSYPLLQAYDFWHLYKEFGCDVQIGGSDQWGNIVSGVELIRRKENESAYGLTLPIITDKSTGKKFGKSEGNAVWLDPEMTMPYSFYQFWFNVNDDNVGDYLKLFTMMSVDEIGAAVELSRRNPGERHAQKILAREVTLLVHGERTAKSAEQISETLFGDRTLKELSKDAVEQLQREAPSSEVHDGESIVDVLVRSGLASSKREARQLLSSKAVMLNSESISEPERTLSQSDFSYDIALLRKGARGVCVLKLI